MRPGPRADTPTSTGPGTMSTFIDRSWSSASGSQNAARSATTADGVAPRREPLPRAAAPHG